MLQSISFFPYSNWWRLGGKSQLKNQFGGICTLIVLGLVGVIFVFKLTQVFNKTKMTVTQTFQQTDFAGLTNFTTYQDIPAQGPFMMAIYPQPFYSDLSGDLTSNDFLILGWNHYTKGGEKIVQQIQLQKCSQDHFSKLSNNALKAFNDTLPRLLCLPINKTYQFGGDFLYGNDSFVAIGIYCKTYACATLQIPPTFSYYYLKSVANPYSAKTPIISNLQYNEVVMIANTTSSKLVKLELNTIITDNSLLPSSDLSQNIIYSPNANFQSSQYTSLEPTTSIKILRSKVSYTYQRTYQKLLDAISYIGGIFQSILALFFFVQIFNASYFQMSFASKYFKCKEAKNYFFGKFIKQKAYDALYETRFKPQWKQTEVRRKITEAVTSLQDILYINRRIDFLEKATSFLFQKHQLQGLRLLHNKTDSEVLTDYKKQKFRDQFIFFLKRKQKNETQQLQNQRHMRDEAQVQDKDGRNTKRKSKKQTPGVIYQSEIEQQNKKKINVSLQADFGRKRSMISMQNRADFVYSSENIFKDSNIPHSSSSRDFQTKKQVIFEQIQGEELYEFDNAESDNLLIEDIEGDLKRLVTEAQKPTGDKRSKRIYEQMESQMRQMLKGAIVQFDGKQVSQVHHPIAQIYEHPLNK